MDGVAGAHAHDAAQSPATHAAKNGDAPSIGAIQAEENIEPKSNTGRKDMDPLKQSELEAKLRNALKEHQREGLNMIGNVDQLVTRLLRAVAEWVEEEPLSRQKSA